jgi:hypothetical protein
MLHRGQITVVAGIVSRGEQIAVVAGMVGRGEQVRRVSLVLTCVPFDVQP